VKDICDGLIYLHNYATQILHLDLKPKNILIDGFQEPRAVIADFGLATMKRESQQTAFAPRGTYPYMAPEIVTSIPTDKTDMYSVAIIMWEMLTCKEPYSHLPIPPVQILGIVQQGARPLWDEADLPPVVITLVESCWGGDPTTRPSAIQLMEKVDTLYNNIDIIF